MRTRHALLVVALVAAAPALAADDGKVHGSLMFGLGVKQLGSEWEPAATQLAVGLLDGDITPKGSPVAISFDLSFSWSDNVPRRVADASPWLDDYSLDSGVWDFTLGIRKYVPLGKSTRLFVGFGAGVFTVSEHGNWGFYTGGDERSESGSSFGPFVEGGVRSRLGEGWEWGLRVRKAFATATLFAQELDAGGLDVTVVFGPSW